MSEVPRPGAGRRNATRVVLASTGGLAWGAATSGLQTVLPEPLSGLANAVSPWVALAFVIGSSAHRAWVAVVAGLLVCWGEVIGYYSVSALRGFAVYPPTVIVWLGAAVPGGAVFAAAGYLWARGPRPVWSGLGSALLAGIFLIEGLATYGWTLGYVDDAVLFTAIGALLLALLPVTGPGARAWRTRGVRRRAVTTATLWLGPVLTLGAAGTALIGVIIG